MRVESSRGAVGVVAVGVVAGASTPRREPEPRSSVSSMVGG